MKVYYDKEVDALYIKLGNKTPEGVIEISEGVNLDTTSDDKIIGIEFLTLLKKYSVVRLGFCIIMIFLLFFEAVSA